MDIKDGRYQIDSRDADLSHSRFKRVAMLKAAIDDANMSELAVTNVTMKGAKWANVDMSGLSIVDANLLGASISASNLEGMTIDGVLVTKMMAAYRAAQTAEGV